MALFREKYRIESARLPGWDYSSPGHYFVTICARGRKCVFGKIAGTEVHLSPTGRIVAEEWLRTPQVRPNVMLDAWVVMPNHIHGIVIICEQPVHPPVETLRGSVSGHEKPVDSRVETLRGSVSETPHRGSAETPHRGSTETPHRGVSTGAAGLKAGSLGAIIGQFKSGCTKRLSSAGIRDFTWQPRYYEHIIRSEENLGRIREYIANNPGRWADDEDNPANQNV